jgi:adenylate kinase family enzyme
MRIAIIGSSGSGKSTLGRRLAERLGAPSVELDALNWEANWRDLSRQDPEEFVRRVKAAVAGDAWVTDGNYTVARPLILARATDLIWLDYDRPLIMSRVIRRSVTRAFSRDELWPGTGNTETWRRWLDKDHPIRWAWDTYDRRKVQYTEMFADPRLADIRKHRLRKPAEAEALVEHFAARDL